MLYKCLLAEIAIEIICGIKSYFSIYDCQKVGLKKFTTYREHQT